MKQNISTFIYIIDVKSTLILFSSIFYFFIQTFASSYYIGIQVHKHSDS